MIHHWTGALSKYIHAVIDWSRGDVSTGIRYISTDGKSSLTPVPDLAYIIGGDLIWDKSATRALALEESYIVAQEVLNEDL